MLSSVAERVTRLAQNDKRPLCGEGIVRRDGRRRGLEAVRRRRKRALRLQEQRAAAHRQQEPVKEDALYVDRIAGEVGV